MSFPARSCRRLALLFLLVFAVLGGAMVVHADKKPTTEELEEMLATNPESIEVMLQLGVQYSLQQKYLEAVKLFQRIIQKDPNNFHAYNNLGIVYKKAGQLNDCLVCYQHALRINPDSYWVYYNLGLIYEENRNVGAARDMYAKAIALNPEFEQAIERLKNLPAPGKVPPLPSLADSGKGSGGGSGSGSGSGDGKGSKGGSKAPVVEQGSGDGSDAGRRLPLPPAKGKIETATKRQGAGREQWLQAMSALARGDTPKALDHYVRCLLTDREFLAEPDNGLIQKGLELLRDRPQALTDGVFYRGYLKSLQGADKAEVVADLDAYLKGNPGGSFVTQATGLRDKLQAEIDAQLAATAQVQANQAMIQGAPPVVPAATYTPRPSDVEVQKMTVGEVIDEAKRLNREGRQRDALVVLKGGLDKEPKNTELMLVMANTYVDLMLLKGDMEAGRYARETFEQILAVAPNSKEGALAKSMVLELNSRLR